jgi:hypothetical protein
MQQQQAQQLHQQQQLAAEVPAMQPQLPLGHPQQWPQQAAAAPLAPLLPGQALPQQQLLNTAHPQLQPIQQQYIQLQQQQQQQQALLLQQQQQQQTALLQQAGLQAGCALPRYPSPAAPAAGMAGCMDPFAMQQQQHLAVEPPTQPIAIPQQQQQQWLPDIAVRVQPGGMSPSSAASSSQLSPKSQLQLQYTHSSSLLGPAAAARVDGANGLGAAQPPELAVQLTQQQQQQLLQQQLQQQQAARLAGSSSPRAFNSSPLRTQHSMRQQLAAASLDDGTAAASLLLMGASPGSGPRLSGEGDGRPHGWLAGLMIAVFTNGR